MKLSVRMMQALSVLCAEYPRSLYAFEITSALSNYETFEDWISIREVESALRSLAGFKMVGKSRQRDTKHFSYFVKDAGAVALKTVMGLEKVNAAPQDQAGQAHAVS